MKRRAAQHVVGKATRVRGRGCLDAWHIPASVPPAIVSPIPQPLATARRAIDAAVHEGVLAIITSSVVALGFSGRVAERDDDHVADDHRQHDEKPADEGAARFQAHDDGVI